MRFYLCGIVASLLTFVCNLPSQAFPPGIADPRFDNWPTANQPVETIDVQVHEVNLVLSITDHKGKFVKGLQPSDLTILDNGVQQTKLTFFERATDLPIKIALVLDISGSVAYQFDSEKQAIKSFLKAVMRPSDSAMLFAFNQDVQLASPVTNDWNDTARRVKRLKPGGKTALYDAVSEASQWLALDYGPARRIIIVISDGEENESKTTIDTTIGNALKAETTIYSVNVGEDLVGVDDESLTDEAEQGKAVLKHLAEATGGTYLDYPEGHNITDAFWKIRRELRSQYALAYKLSNPGVRTFHRLQVLVANRLRVHCRSGYFVK
jgi:VWFA-related protein